MVRPARTSVRPVTVFVQRATRILSMSRVHGNDRFDQAFLKPQFIEEQNNRRDQRRSKDQRTDNKCTNRPSHYRPPGDNFSSRYATIGSEESSLNRPRRLPHGVMVMVMV
jgi:hypothetical protein